MVEKKYYLYIKTSPFGLKYLGKTTKDPYIYMGSGKLWKRHIKKHNLSHLNIITEIIFETNNELELINAGIKFSIEHNIVNSKEWANLRIENGDGGDTSKYIDYNKPNFHKSDRAKHLNIFNSEKEKKEAIINRTLKINYKDQNRLKKIKENTNWVSWRESIKSRKIDYSKMKRNVVNKKAIIQLTIDDKYVSEYESITEASNVLGCSFGGIMQCLGGRNKTAFGYKWKYKINVKT